MLYLLTTHWDDLENNLIYIGVEERYGITCLDEILIGIEDLTLEEFLQRIDASRKNEGK